MLCDSRAQLNSFSVPNRRVVPVAGSSRKVSAGWNLRACPQGGYAGDVEGDSSSLAPPLYVGAQEGTPALGKQDLSHTPAGYAHPQC